MALEYSSREFVQALKTTADHGAPAKIEIARRAWDDRNFYLPSKAEVIVEWILSTLLKNKSQDSSTAPIFKQEYWKLLLDVLSDRTSVHARPLKTWLTPLLHRIPLQAILSTFLVDYREREADDKLTGTVSSCVNILWPISVQKMSMESLADLFGLLLRSTGDGHPAPGVLTIALLITSSYRTSLGNAANKKKFYQLFLQSFLTQWIHILSQYTTSLADLSPEDFRLYQNIYESGADTLFNLDILRQLSDSHPTDQSNALFRHLNKPRPPYSENVDVLSAIPPLFSSYVQAVKRYRGAVFSQHSNAANAVTLNDEIQAASMRFFANCEAVVVGDSTSGGKAKEMGIWHARLKLLETIFEERLFNVQQEGATTMLNTVIEDAVSVISCSWNGEHGDVISLAIKCLHKIGQIDCDLLLPFLPRIFPSLLPVRSFFSKRGNVLTDTPSQVPAIDSSPSDFLDLILDYHTKTRSINVHITNLLMCLSSTSIPIESTDIRGVHESCFSGHILSNRHLDRLGNAVQTFLTPGQTVKSVEGLLDALDRSLQGFFDAVEGKDRGIESPKKKKRGMEAEEGTKDINSRGKLGAHDTEFLAVSFVLQAYLALVILPNLPLQTLNESSAAKIQETVSQFRVSTVERPIEKLLKLDLLLSGGEKKKRKRDPLASHERWNTQIVAAAILRIHYALSITKSLNVGKQGFSSDIIEQLRNIVTKECGKGSLIAELELEIYRTQLQYIERGIEEGEAQKIFDSVLSYLISGFRPLDSSWSGLPHDLKTQQSGALAVLHLMLERWLSLIDRFASPSQITNIIQLYLSIELREVSAASGSWLRPNHLLLRLLHNAEFWEMHNFRSAFLSYLVQTTESGSQGLGTESAVYCLLLYVPAEYLTKTARIHLIKQAYLADLRLSRSLSKSKQSHPASVLENLVTLRVFLKRIIGLVGFERVSEIDLGDFVTHLITFNPGEDGPKHKLFAVSTLDLIELCFCELLKDPKTHSDALFKVIGSFSQYPVFVRKDDGHFNFESRAIATLLNVITRLKDGSSLSAECMSSLHTFLEQLGRTTSDQLRKISRPPLAGHCEVLAGWCCVLKLRKWLNETQSEKDRDVGRRLVSLALQEPSTSHKLDDIPVSIFAILRAELNLLSRPLDRQKQLELILAAFVAFKGASGDSAACVQLDEHISSIAKGLPPDDYSYTLDLLSESLTPDSASTATLETILHLSVLLLRDHPPHTLKYVQSFATQTLNTFAGSRLFTNGSISLRLLTLEFILQQCSERPAALQQVDMGSIFTVLFHFLEPCEDRDEITTPEIFHRIVGSVGALVRLRRDLLTSVLPHLGLILRILLSAMRSCRPQLGTKQTAMVMRTQPRWITAKQPLGSGESRMLSRLLEMLNVKTVIRSHTASETQKAESLSKPFSKHAAYVLVAYIEALNEPLCVLSMEVRRELEPGLFALCGLMGEYARDALVVSLDANGKVTLKLIWKEYEKQRYVGKG